MKKRPVSKENIKYFKEKFISDYSKKKGWDKNNLTPNQMLEIVGNIKYKSPNL